MNKSLLNGRWVSVSPIESDDYLMEYIIKEDGEEFSIIAYDLQDKEELEITDIKWNGEILSFKSFMPSTQRSGFNQFRINSDGNVEAKFTFTVLEELKRLD